MGFTEPLCHCGAGLVWEECDQCGGDGVYDLYEDDPLWYAPGETEPCQTCQGKGGWWFCLTQHEAILPNP